jgi:hypothetical protein
VHDGPACHGFSSGWRQATVPEQAFTCSLDTPKKNLNLLAAALCFASRANAAAE